MPFVTTKLGVRTEVARALRWEHIDFGDAATVPPRPASVAVLRSLRAKGRAWAAVR